MCVQSERWMFNKSICFCLSRIRTPHVALCLYQFYPYLYDKTGFCSQRYCFSFIYYHLDPKNF